MINWTVPSAFAATLGECLHSCWSGQSARSEPWTLRARQIPSGAKLVEGNQVPVECEAETFNLLSLDNRFLIAPQVTELEFMEIQAKLMKLIEKQGD